MSLQLSPANTIKQQRTGDYDQASRTCPASADEIANGHDRQH
jgi:hypothetical protein